MNLTLLPFVVDGVTVNLLDTPGYADFTGDLRAGLRAADCALFVVSACDGIDGVTRLLWEECAQVGMPRAVVITKIDHGRADFATVLAECQDAFGEGVAPLYLPTAGGAARRQRPDRAAVGDAVRVLVGQALDPKPVTRGSDKEAMASARDALIEGIITESEDETLMERYLSGEAVDTSVLISDLEKAVARGSFYPVLAVASPLGIGLAELLEVVTQALPSPLEHPLPPVTSAAGRHAGLRALLRPRRAAAGRGRQDHLRPLRGAHLAGAGVLRHAHARTPWCTCPGTGGSPAGTPITMTTRRSAR